MTRARNLVAVSVLAAACGTSPVTTVKGEPVSIRTLIARYMDADHRWGWGGQFHVRKSDGLVLAESCTCTGAG
jgi:hypothetical protein